MSVNYYNSAGTDLDNLFYTNNGNAGAVGFAEASGQDLGNRYTNASTLGYSVGYVNSAGTDLGYLRGNAVKPTISAAEVSIHGKHHTSSTGPQYTTSGEDTEITGYSPSHSGNGYVYYKYNCSGTAPLYCEIRMALTATNDPITGRIMFQYNSNADMRNWNQYSVGNSGYETLAAWATGTYYTVYNGGCDTMPNCCVAWKDDISYNGTRSSADHVYWGIYVAARCYNAAGSTDWIFNRVDMHE